MQSFDLDDLIKEDFIFTNVNGKTKEDIINKLCDILIERQYVTENFTNDVLAREEKYPTGLPTEILKVAIPHAETSENVKIPTIVAAKLENSVVFTEMGSENTKIDIDFVLLLALKGSKIQLKLLPKLISIFSQEEIMLEIKSATHPTEIKKIISKNIN